MSEAQTLALPASPDAAASIWLEPWHCLDAAQRLAHFRSARRAQYFPVADPDETSPEKMAGVLHGTFEFNGEAHALGDGFDWLTNPSVDVEWHILLHKFYYAVGLGMAFERSAGQADGQRWAARWMQLIDSWIASTPPGFIAADVTGRRVQNWIYSYYYFVTNAAPACAAGNVVDPAFHERFLHSLHEQVEFLCANLTPKRNHRTLELYAIFLAGVVFPEMRNAARWRAFALQQSVLNITDDLLADGVHCELSTDYHHLVLKNYLNFRRLATLNDISVPAALDAALERALEFSLHVHKPDGLIPSLSDGDSRSFLDLLAFGADLFQRPDMRFVASAGTAGTPPAARAAHFAASGYSVIRSDWVRTGSAFADAQHLVFDSGPLGEGNHGHFDCLSFELAAYGRSLVVDPGRYTYSEAGPTNWRVQFRSTAVHNTVCVDGRNQTRYLPKPIKPSPAHTLPANDPASAHPAAAPSRHAPGSVRHKISGPAPDALLRERFHGAHLDLLHGQARSHEYDAVHDRCIVFVDRTYWIVSDWLRAPTAHSYALRFQLGAHAQGHSSIASTDAARTHSPGLLIAQPLRAGTTHQLVPSWVSTRYGHKEAAPALTCGATGQHCDFDSVLVPWATDEPALRVEDVPVGAASTTDMQATRALRIQHRLHGTPVIDTWLHVRDAAPQPVRTDGFVLHGRWAFWRCNVDGQVLFAASHAGAALFDNRAGDARSIALDAPEVA